MECQRHELLPKPGRMLQAAQPSFGGWATAATLGCEEFEERGLSIRAFQNNGIALGVQTHGRKGDQARKEGADRRHGWLNWLSMALFKQRRPGPDWPTVSTLRSSRRLVFAENASKIILMM